MFFVRRGNSPNVSEKNWVVYEDDFLERYVTVIESGDIVERNR